MLDEYGFGLLAKRVSAALSYSMGIASSWGEVLYKVVALICYSLVYLEVLNKESAAFVCVSITSIRHPSLPLMLLFSGCGTHYSPFYLDPSACLYAPCRSALSSPSSLTSHECSLSQS